MPQRVQSLLFLPIHFIEMFTKRGGEHYMKQPDSLATNYTYIVKCRDSSLYTGWTNDLERRIREHNTGKGAKYTKSRRPVVLAYFEAFETRQEAMSREYAIKRLKRADKLKLLESEDNPVKSRQ